VLPVINPVGSAPLFLDMTDGLDPATRNRLAARVATYSFGLLLGSMLLGSFVLRFFDLSLPVVQVPLLAARREPAKDRGESSGDGSSEEDRGGQCQQHDVQPAPGSAQRLRRSEFDAVRMPRLLTAIRSLHHRRLLRELATAPSMPVALPY
jgi:MarC family integral membrane protein